MKHVAIVLAAGQGKRMNSDIQKQYLLLNEKPVLYYSLSVLEKSFIDEIVLVVGSGETEYCTREIVEKYKFKKISNVVEGGKERYHSVQKGIEAVKSCDFLYIHDGARPFLTEEILNRAKENVLKYQACVVGMPSKDTVKISDKLGFAQNTPNRDQVWLVQTPQVFSFLLIKEAYNQLIIQEENLIKEGTKITDDAMVVETFSNIPVKLVEGSYQNIKITTPEDLEIAKLFVV